LKNIDWNQSYDFSNLHFQIHVLCLTSDVPCSRVKTSVDRHSFLSFPDLQARQSSSLDWRVGRSVTFGSNRLQLGNTTRSAEQLSRSAPLTSDLQTPSTRYANPRRCTSRASVSRTQQKQIIYDKLESAVAEQKSITVDLRRVEKKSADDNKGEGEEGR